MGKLAAIATSVRRMRSKGWTVESIARLYRVAVADVLAILRLHPPRTSISRPPPQPKTVDPWKGPAGDWRFRDDVGFDQVEAPAQICAIELPDQVAAAGIAAEPVKPAPSTWCGPSSPCATSLHGGRRRIRD